MLLSRRTFIKGIASSGLLLASSSSAALLSNPSSKQTVLYSAAMNQAGQYFIAALSSEGALLFKTPLPARAHAITINPSKNELIVFARRPRHFLWVLNAKTGQIIHKRRSEENRPLYGHGVFSNDGKRLYVTANDLDHQRGVVMILDAGHDYRKVGEFSSGGIGSHELSLLSDGKTLVVANGGILTHPESGRSKLNLDTMTPALTYIDAQQGKVIGDYRLAPKYHQLSIRHLAVNQQDTVCFAMQYQGSRRHRFPLVGFHQGQSSLQLAEAPEPVLSTMKNYCGSVCVDTSGRIFAVSSPKGNLITTWNAQGRFLSSQAINDGCGIAAGTTANTFYLSSGVGEIHRYQAAKKKNSLKQDELMASFKQYHWDNHLFSHTFS